MTRKIKPEYIVYARTLDDKVERVFNNKAKALAFARKMFNVVGHHEVEAFDATNGRYFYKREI